MRRRDARPAGGRPPQPVRSARRSRPATPQPPAPRLLSPLSPYSRYYRYRQHILALEKRILTNSFSLRFGTTMHGMVFVNAFFGLRCFSMPVADFKPEMSKLAYRLMHNSLLVVDAGPSRSPGTPGSGPPNSPNSPAASESCLLYTSPSPRD